MTTTGEPARRSFFGHPRMLANLFGLELWERFSFYGMQGIVLYYMYYYAAQGGLGIDRGLATGIVGAYGGGVYLSTIVFAWMADRLLGPERVLFYSAELVMLGHLGLAVLPGVAGLAVGLILIALGSGGVKANATALVGTLYTERDLRRDAGFLIFYMGINTGALIGPLLTGLLQTTRGFHCGFGLAAAGMLVGLIQYGLTRKDLPAEAHHVANPLSRQRLVVMVAAGLAAVTVTVGAVRTGVLNTANLAPAMAGTAGVAAVGYFAVILSSRRITATERQRVLGFVPLFLASAAFWSLFQQQFTVVAVYSDQRLDRRILGATIPPSWVQSINPVFVIVFSGVFAAVWTKLGDRQPRTPIKFSLGLATVGFAFLAFLPLAGGGPHSTPLAALVAILFLFTMGELLLSPTALSVTTKLAPQAFHTQMVALLFLSVSLGTTTAGILAGHYDPVHEVGYFAVIGTVAIALGAALAVAAPGINRLLSGIR